MSSTSSNENGESSESSETSENSTAVYDRGLLDWLKERDAALRFDWMHIFQDFYTEYSKTFARSKKAHFDSLPAEWTAEEKVVDGARAKWCNLLVMDALIYFLQHGQFDLSYRRTFNQQKVLSDCIMKELQRCNQEVYTHVVRHKTTTFRDASVDVDPESKNWIVEPEVFGSWLSIGEVFYPWDDLTTLKTSMLREPTSKSKRKFQMIIESLCTHEVLEVYDNDIMVILAAAVFKAILVFPLVPGGYCFQTTTNSRFYRIQEKDSVGASLRPIRKRACFKDVDSQGEEEEDPNQSPILKFSPPIKVPWAKLSRREQNSPVGIETEFEDIALARPTPTKKRVHYTKSKGNDVAINLAVGKRSKRSKTMPQSSSSSSNYRSYEYGAEFAKRQKMMLDALSEPDFELFSVLDDNLDSSLAFDDWTQRSKTSTSVTLLNPDDYLKTKDKEPTLDSILLDWLDDSSSTSEFDAKEGIANGVPKKPEESHVLQEESYENNATEKINTTTKCLLKKRLPEFYSKTMTVVDVISSSKRFYDHFPPTSQSVSSSFSKPTSSHSQTKATNEGDEDSCAEPLFSSK